MDCIVSAGDMVATFLSSLRPRFEAFKPKKTALTMASEAQKRVKKFVEE